MYTVDEIKDLLSKTCDELRGRDIEILEGYTTADLANLFDVLLDFLVETDDQAKLFRVMAAAPEGFFLTRKDGLFTVGVADKETGLVMNGKGQELRDALEELATWFVVLELWDNLNSRSQGAENN